MEALQHSQGSVRMVSKTEGENVRGEVLREDCPTLIQAHTYTHACTYAHTDEQPEHIMLRCSP